MADKEITKAEDARELSDSELEEVAGGGLLTIALCLKEGSSIMKN